MSDITSAVAFTEEMLGLCTALQQAVRQQDWVAAANLESTRSSLLRSTLAESPSLLTSAAWADLLEKIQAGDRELLVQGENEHRQLSARILQFRQGARARDAYMVSSQD